LIELLVVIAIAAVLAGLAVPSFQALIASSNLTSTTNELIATLARAKSDAIRRGKRVTVCVSTDGVSCTTIGDWTQGWIIFQVNDRSATTATVEKLGDITAVTAGLTNNIIVKATGTYFSFTADGVTKTMTGSNGDGSIRICSPSSALTNDTRARKIVINWAGRVSVEKPTGISATCP